MPRLGKFSGKIYPDDYDFSQCPECCLVISEKEANDEEFLQRQRLINKIVCIGCMGCPAIKTGVYVLGEENPISQQE